jgi:hypothetical protein
MRSILPILAALAATAPLTAFAQGPLLPPPGTVLQAPGDIGFPIGEKSRIHTLLDLGAGFDSNPDRVGSSVMGHGGSDWFALIRPGVHAAVPGNDVMVDLLGQLDINQYFGSGSQVAQTNFGTFINGAFRLGSDTSLLNFSLNDQVIRTPSYLDDLGTVAAEERRYAQWYNRGTAAVTLRPGGGALSFDLGYLNSVIAFDDPLFGTSIQNGGFFDAKLKFLPKTALDFHADFSAYSTNTNNLPQHSTPYNVWLGLIGQITPHLVANLTAGFTDTLTWDNGFFSGLSGTNRRTISATAELTYSPLEMLAVMLGYRRYAQPIVVLQNYVDDTVYARLALRLGTRLLLTGFGQFEARSYGGGQSAKLVTTDARLEYYFFNFLSAALNYRVLIQTDAQGMAPNNLLLDNYTRQQALLLVALKY